MSELNDMGPIYFNIKGKLVRLLGRESLSNEAVAICELIKNSYDAEATETTVYFENVKSGSGVIRIIDNGDGLTFNEIEKIWMTVATDEKEKQPYTKKLKRRKIGEKGVARFATAMIAHKLELISKPKGESRGYKLLINWDEYDIAPQFERVPNKIFSFKKKKKDQGLELMMSPLKEKWDTKKMQLLYRRIGLLTPPVEAKLKGDFNVKISTNEFQKYSRIIKPSFLRQAIFTLRSSLSKDGTIKYSFKAHKGKSRSDTISNGEYTCGPVEFRMYFFYRDKGKYPFKVDIKALRKTLNEYGGLHLYRDDLKVNLSDEDWAGLDEIRINDPSWYPSNTQLIGIVRIGRDGNPGIVDTTTRETIIEKQNFKDLKRFIHRSLEFFVDCRKKREPKKAKKAKQKKVTVAKKVAKKLTTDKMRESFIDFGTQYPEVFYTPLENEINYCYLSNLSNAVLLLSRKMAENLVYNLFEHKFPKDVKLRWNTSINRPFDFNVLLDNLKIKKNKFTQEEKRLIDKFLSLCKPFKRQANAKAHNIMEYLEDRIQLKSLKIPEIMELALKLITKAKY